LLKAASKVSVVAKRPEAELLLCCARTRIDSEKVSRISELLRQEMNWAYLLRMARAHRITPLLFWHLNAASPEAVPEDVLEQLRNHFHNGNLRSLVLTGELLKLLGLFETYEIPAIPYKGPALATFAYGNLALREFDDLDILIHKQDVPRAKELLISVGYQPQYYLNRAQEVTFLRYGFELGFTRVGGEGAVDLHWELAEKHFSFSLDPRSLWGRLERVPLGGGSVPTLMPEDLLLVLCAHGSKHLWQRLMWICDVAELVRVSDGMDWVRVVERAATLGSERMLFLGLYLASDLLGMALPVEIAQRIQDDTAVKMLAGQVRERLFRGANGSPAVFEELPFHSFHIKVRERLRDKIQYCLRAATATTVRDWMLLPLPRYLYPLYYLIRPFRMIGKYGPRLVKRLFYN